MDTLWEVIKAAFSGIFNMVTLLGVLIGVLIYGLIWKISVRFEGSKDLDCVISLIGSIQLYIGALQSKWARKFANWLWTKIIILDYEKRRRLVIHSANEEYQIWLILQFTNFEYDKKVVDICRRIASKPGVSERLADVAAKLYGEMIKHNG